MKGRYNRRWGRMNEVGFGPPAWSPLARAWTAYHLGDSNAALEVHTDDGGSEPMPVAVFFRGGGELRGPDREALRMARGRVLDVGAGVGALALLLQETGFSVTALEVIPQGVEIMRERGVADPREGRLENLSEEASFDTILLLMNGTTLVGSPDGLVRLCRAVADRLAPGGKVLVDSTDLRDDEGGDRRPDGRYVGEIQLQLSWRGLRSEPFSVLYADPDLLAACAGEVGLACRVVERAEGGAYLAELGRG